MVKVYGDTRLITTLAKRVNNSQGSHQSRLEAFKELQKYKNMTARETVEFWGYKFDENFKDKVYLDSNKVVEHFKELGWDKEYNSQEIQSTGAYNDYGYYDWFKQSKESAFVTGKWG